MERPSLLKTLEDEAAGAKAPQGLVRRLLADHEVGLVSGGSYTQNGGSYLSRGNTSYVQNGGSFEQFNGSYVMDGGYHYFRQA